jgi:general secretion pathway protein L
VFSEFLTWWRTHLLELVPERVRRSLGQNARALVVDAATPGMLTLFRRRGGEETKAAQFRTDESGLPALRAAIAGRQAAEPVLLRLPPQVVLERAVSLPLAAERDPERVLGYDMERLTPFATDEVYWGYTVQSRDKARGRLMVNLSLVTRASVRELIDTLTDCGARPSLLEAQTPNGPRRIRLQHEVPQGGIGRLTPRAMAMVLAGLAALAIISPFLRQSLQMSEAQDTLDRLAPQMAQVDQLRSRILGAGAGSGAVAAETRRLGDMMEALAAVTEILPDDSYLSEFDMRERKMTLTGASASAPKLISALSADPRIRNPAFTAPVTSENGKDSFTIRADLAP